MADEETTSPLREEQSSETNACWASVNVGLQVSLEEINADSARDLNEKDAADVTVKVKSVRIQVDGDDDSDNSSADSERGMSSWVVAPAANGDSDGDPNADETTAVLCGNGNVTTVDCEPEVSSPAVLDKPTDGRVNTAEGFDMFDSGGSRHIKHNTGGMSLAQVVELAQKKERKNRNQNVGGWRKVKQLVREVADMKKSMLIHTKRQRVEERDFQREVRPTQDIKNFMNEATILLSLPDTTLDDVINPMVEKLIENEPGVKIAEARRAIFAEDSCSLLTNTLQSTVMLGGGLFFEDSWLCAFASLKHLQRRRVAIGRLRRPTNLGFTCSDVRFVVLVLAPIVEKGTKNSMETAITFSTLFTDINFRVSLWEEATNEEELLDILQERVNELEDKTNVRNVVRRRESEHGMNNPFLEADTNKMCTFFMGVRGDLKRRMPHYKSDFLDGLQGGKHTIRILIMTIVFLYFSCLLFTLSLGVLNDKNTYGYIGVRKALVGQVIAGLVGGIVGGQPLLVMATSAPLALFTKVIYIIAKENNWDFYQTYGTIGIFSSGFLIVFAMFDVSKLMKYSTRSVDEVFTLFVSCTLIKEAIDAVITNFNANYSCLKITAGHFYMSTNISSTISIINTSQEHNILKVLNATVEGAMPELVIVNETSIVSGCKHGTCYPENSVLFLLLMMGVPWIGITLYRFKRSPFLATLWRELLSNQALAITVIIWSFVGSYCFRDIHMNAFPYQESNDIFTIPKYTSHGYIHLFASLGLGLSLALMVLMEHNITGSVVNSPENKLKKGTSYHWDLLLCGILNLFFSLFAMPMVHGIVPLSPMHVRSLADVEERVHYGYVQTIIVRVRETRLTLIMAHAFIGISMLMLPSPLKYIPMAVLAGVYIFLAIQSLIGNQFFERLLLFITEQSAYPPSHYVRRVPQRKMHLFTVIELIELIMLCVFGMSPISYMKTVFPFILILFIPIRQLIIPNIIEKKYLESLDLH
ncbi:solute carrier family 4 member 11-like [Ptychodera flava]|uniref:solute carrier family 4 member 11-like n=1 Tax=Ptychodera flava TaxID=63121 RepID=UPI003969EEFE